MTQLVQIRKKSNPNSQNELCLDKNIIWKDNYSGFPNENTTKRKNELTKCFRLVSFHSGISKDKNDNLVDCYINYIYNKVLENPKIVYEEKKHIIIAENFDPDLTDLIFCFKKNHDVYVNSFRGKRYWIIVFNCDNTENILETIKQNYKNFCIRMKTYLKNSGCDWHIFPIFSEFGEDDVGQN